MVWSVLVVSDLSHGVLIRSRTDSHIGEARRLVTAKGLYLNNVVVESQHTLRREDLIDGRVAVLRAGKNKYLVLDVQA
jgi:tyrosyl-tRNA synthetase